MSEILSLIYFIFALGIIVLVHEFGHLIVAKRNNVYCHEFSIGMGPMIKELMTDKTGCKYVIRMLPLGGYVMLAGEDSHLEQDGSVDEDKLLTNKSPWIRFKVLIAGSLMNFILALGLLFLLAFFGGVSNSDTTQVEVIENYPADVANIPTGSSIISIDGQAVSTFTDIAYILSESSDKILINYNYQGDDYSTYVTKNDEGNIGISPTKSKYRLIGSLQASISSLIGILVSIFISIIALFTDQYGINDLTGPIGIYSMSSEILSYGFSSAVMWIVYLSMNIGLVNLLPIPALDGGRLVFVFYEMVTKKKPNKKIEELALLIGILILFSLFIIVTFNDIFRLF